MKILRKENGKCVEIMEVAKADVTYEFEGETKYYEILNLLGEDGKSHYHEVVEIIDDNLIVVEPIPESSIEKVVPVK